MDLRNAIAGLGGIRPAARRLGIPEATLRYWVNRKQGVPAWRTREKRILEKASEQKKAA